MQKSSWQSTSRPKHRQTHLFSGKYGDSPECFCKKKIVGWPPPCPSYWNPNPLNTWRASQLFAWIFICEIYWIHLGFLWTLSSSERLCKFSIRLYELSVWLYRCVTCGQLSEAQVLHGSGGDQRFLRVVQHVSQCVHTYMEVGDVDAHGLFTHSRLVRVPGRLNNKTKQNKTDVTSH